MKQTAVEWLIEKIKNDHNNNSLTGREWVKIFQQAKEMEREQMVTNCNQMDKPFLIHGEHQIQMLEISDEQIRSAANNVKSQTTFYSFIEGAKWYREQLKQK
jgi:hypothetical protein